MHQRDGWVLMLLVTPLFGHTAAQSTCAVNTYSFSPGQNVARMCGVNNNTACPSDMSSYHADTQYRPAMGNDGDANTFAHTANNHHTTAATPNFYVVDFQQRRSPSSVAVSVTHIPSRMGGASLRLGDSAVWSQNTVCATLTGVASQTVTCSLTGRYMFLVGLVAGSTPFAVSELQVFINPECATCPVGSTANAGSTSATACKCMAGRSGPNGGPCTMCDAGTYKDTIGTSTCQACPLLSSSPTGSTSVNNCSCIEGYNTNSSTGSIVCTKKPDITLCSGLSTATAHVLSLDANEHKISKLQESQCVHIDSCTQKTLDGKEAAAGTWHHVAALGLTSSGDGAHYNHHALEYARVPQGIVLETCPPDFAHYRATGTWRCNADPATLVRIQGACPSAAPHTILDCLAPTQFDAGSESKQLNPV